MNALLKIPFLISSQIATASMATTPSTALSEELKAAGLEGMESVLPGVFKTLTWLACFCEIATIFSAGATSIRITPLFLLGWAINLIGGIIGVQCYEELDHHFALFLNFRKKRRVDISGPHFAVHFPSYFGGFVVWIGVLLTHLTEGSWVMECLGFKNNLFLTMMLWVASLLLCTIPTSLRRKMARNLLRVCWEEGW